MHRDGLSILVNFLVLYFVMKEMNVLMHLMIESFFKEFTPVRVTEDDVLERLTQPDTPVGTLKGPIWDAIWYP